MKNKYCEQLSEERVACLSGSVVLKKKIGIGFVLDNYIEGLACLPSYYFDKPTSHYTLIRLEYATKCACSVKTRKQEMCSAMFDIFFNIVKTYLTSRSGSINSQGGLSI